MLDILAVIAPIFMLIGLGYLAVRLALFPQDKLAALGLLVVRFALPALILHSLSSRSPAELLNTPYLAAYAAGSLAMLLLGTGWAMLARQQPLPRAALYGLGMSCSNSAFVGYPIVYQLLGPVATLALALTMVVENLLMLPLGIALSIDLEHIDVAVAAGIPLLQTGPTRETQVSQEDLCIPIAVELEHVDIAVRIEVGA